MRSLLLVLALPAVASCVRVRAPQPGETAPIREVTLTVEADVTDIPASASELRLWLPVPRDDGAQVVTRVLPDLPVPGAIVTDSRGNPALLLVLPSPAASAHARATFLVSRAERRGTNASHPLSHHARDGAPEPRCGFLLPAEREGALTEVRCWEGTEEALDRHRVGVAVGEDAVLPRGAVDGRPAHVTTTVRFEDR